MTRVKILPNMNENTYDKQYIEFLERELIILTSQLIEVKADKQKLIESLAATCFGIYGGKN